MRHLYLKLYLALVGVLLLALIVAAAGMGGPGQDRAHDIHRVRGLVELMLEGVVAREPSAELDRTLKHWAERLSVDVAVWNDSGRLIAHTTPEPPSLPQWTAGGFFRQGHTPGLLVDASGGRRVAVLFPEYTAPHRRWFRGFLLFAIVTAALCYPIARGITRRLEKLQRTVDAWGAGELGLRARVKGKDEVARLATRFNAAAERIESLVSSQKRMLASASHELRSPLSRVRVALELMATASESRRQELAARADQDIAELDALIEDLLLAARADSGRSMALRKVNLSNLVQEEAERLGVDAQADAVVILGEPRMLRRMLRNLLENAKKHGHGTAVRVLLNRAEGSVRCCVEDEGPGVVEADRERIFEPFYRADGHDEGADGGVGLGLSLVRRIAEYHGGRAWYEARPGGGSRFCVDLPTRAPQAQDT